VLRVAADPHRRQPNAVLLADVLQTTAERMDAAGALIAPFAGSGGIYTASMRCKLVAHYADPQ